MITNKFLYNALSKVENLGERRYNTPSGLLPSVTTILSSTAPVEKKQQLAEWRKRIGVTKATEITSESSARGTRMHKWLEHYVKTGTIDSPGTNPYSIQSHTMATTIINLGLNKCNEFWGSEVSLYFPELYAGTTDLVGVHDNQAAIMDFKQTNKPKKKEWIEDYFLQLCAYSNAHNEVYGTKIRKGVIFMCSPDNIYQEFIIEGSEFDKWTDRWFGRLEEYYISRT